MIWLWAATAVLVAFAVLLGFCGVMIIRENDRKWSHSAGRLMVAVAFAGVVTQGVIVAGVSA